MHRILVFVHSLYELLEVIRTEEHSGREPLE
jgi:hypothetical protein